MRIKNRITRLAKSKVDPDWAWAYVVAGTLAALVASAAIAVAIQSCAAYVLEVL